MKLKLCQVQSLSTTFLPMWSLSHSFEKFSDNQWYQFFLFSINSYFVKEQSASTATLSKNSQHQQNSHFVKEQSASTATLSKNSQHQQNSHFVKEQSASTTTLSKNSQHQQPLCQRTVSINSHFVKEQSASAATLSKNSQQTFENEVGNLTEVFSFVASDSLNNRPFKVFLKKGRTNCIPAFGDLVVDMYCTFLEC